MKTFLTVFFAFQSFVFVHAQELIKQREVGVTLNSFNSFGLTYRTGTSTSLWRFAAITASGNKQKSEDITSGTQTQNKTVDLLLSAGKEFRKNITEKFEFRYGADLQLGYYNLEREYYYSSNQSVSRYVDKFASYGFNLVAGANYVVSKNFVIGIELLPYVSFRNGSSETINVVGVTEPVKSDTSGFSYGLSNSSALLSFVYRW